MFDQLLQAVVLGLIQGLAEWLPISSTAHLIFAERLLGFSATPLFNVALHVGTLGVVVFYFRREVAGILSALRRMDFESEYGRLVPLMAVATVPTAAVGLLYVAFLEASLQTIPVIGVTFLVGASVVYASKAGREDVESVTYPMAFAVGAVQGFAVFPGLSRSGAAISSAMLLGLRREEAFRFSFLLSIPAVLGDLAVEVYAQRGQLAVQGMGPVSLLVGLAVAVIAGYAAIRLVARLVTTRRFHYFAFYTWTLGAALIVLYLTGS